jgi:hypothetical protein
MYWGRWSLSHYHRVCEQSDLVSLAHKKPNSFAVSTRMEEDDFGLTWDVFKFLFLDVHNLVLWLPAFVLAALLRVITITHKFHHQLIFPACELALSSSDSTLNERYRFYYHTCCILLCRPRWKIQPWRSERERVAVHDWRLQRSLVQVLHHVWSVCVLCQVFQC